MKSLRNSLWLEIITWCTVYVDLVDNDSLQSTSPMFNPHFLHILVYSQMNQPDDNCSLVDHNRRKMLPSPCAKYYRVLQLEQEITFVYESLNFEHPFPLPPCTVLPQTATKKNKNPYRASTERVFILPFNPYALIMMMLLNWQLTYTASKGLSTSFLHHVLTIV